MCSPNCASCATARASFDLIVLDPPKFAPTAQHAEKASRAYKDINLLALKLLRPGGLAGDLFVFGRRIGRTCSRRSSPARRSMPRADAAIVGRFGAIGRSSGRAQFSRRRLSEGPACSQANALGGRMKAPMLAQPSRAQSATSRWLESTAAPVAGGDAASLHPACATATLRFIRSQARLHERLALGALLAGRLLAAHAHLVLLRHPSPAPLPKPGVLTSRLRACRQRSRSALQRRPIVGVTRPCGMNQPAVTRDDQLNTAFSWSSPEWVKLVECGWTNGIGSHASINAGVEAVVRQYEWPMQKREHQTLTALGSERVHCRR